MHSEVQPLPLMKTFVRYFFVGGAAAFVDFSVFSLLLYGLSVNWFWAALVGFLMATAVNYVLSVRHVFESGVRFRKSHEISLVFLVSGIGLVLNQLALYVGIALMGFYPLVAKIGATSVVFLWNFFARSRFIFKS